MLYLFTYYTLIVPRLWPHRFCWDTQFEMKQFQTWYIHGALFTKFLTHHDFKNIFTNLSWQVFSNVIDIVNVIDMSIFAYAAAVEQTDHN